jgi:type IV secretory pathway VirB6-like protein
MIVCGHNGNLYFLQKGLLFYEETSLEQVINDLLDKMKKLRDGLAVEFCIKNGYTTEKIKSSDKNTKYCQTYVYDNLFDDICGELKKYNFKFYRENGSKQ